MDRVTVKEKWVKLGLYLLIAYYGGLFCYNHLAAAKDASETPSRKQVEASIAGLDMSSNASKPPAKGKPTDYQLGSNRPLNPSWYPFQQNADVDTYIVHYGVITKKTFPETLRWWVGPWCSGEVQIPGHPKGTRCLFYRPIPSTIFWFQWNTLGFYEDRYTVWNHVLAVPFMLLFVACGSVLFKRFWPQWSGGLYHPLFLLIAVYFQTQDFFNLNVFAMASHDLVFSLWKNIPDLLVAIFLMLAIMAHIWTSSRPIAKWWHPVLWTIPLYLACASKEVALLAALFLPLLDLPVWKMNPKVARYRLVWAVAYFIGFNVFRQAVLGGSGYRYGNNSFWYVRLFNDLTFPWGGTLTLRAWQDVALAGFVLLGVFLTQRQLRDIDNPEPLRRRLFKAWAIPALATILTLGFLHLAVSPEDQLLSFAAGIVIFFTRIFNQTIHLLVLVPILACLLWKQGRAWTAAIYGFFVLTEIPNSFSPGPMHRQFVPSVAWSWLFAMAFILVFEHWLFPAKSRLLAYVAGRMQARNTLPSDL